MTLGLGVGAVGGVTRAAPPDGVVAADRVLALGDAGKRRALLIGTTHYSESAWRTLPNVARDVAALGAVLERRYGYEVKVVVDPDLAGIKRAVRTISEEAGSADDVLVFFSGHGHFDEVDRAGYLVSREGSAQCESGCYPLDNVKRGLYGTAARHVLVMLDVCHGGTFDLQVALGGHDAADKGETVALRRVLKEYARAASRLMFASVGRGVTSDGRAGTNSPFMTSLLGMLDVPGAGVVDIDSVYLAMSTARDPLPVLRPVPFESNIAHHGQGHFLFIERVDFCETASAIVGASLDAVSGASAAVERPYGRSWPGPWILPGARECRVRQWGEGGLQYGCAFGPVRQAEAPVRAAELVAQVARCFPAEARMEDAAARAVVRGRAVRAQSA
ncbi:MAG: caspase family protein, partial [Deltaproteobacteria bacterium]|nr:caspase family protein [Deltaproteobacteria bacterium]